MKKEKYFLPPKGFNVMLGYVTQRDDVYKPPKPRHRATDDYSENIRPASYMPDLTPQLRIGFDD